MKKFIFKNKNGYSLIEVLFYTGIFTLVFFLIINSIITFMDSFKQISKNTELIQSSQILETITREIKLANEVQTFGNSTLVLKSKNDADQDRIVSFIKEGNNINLSIEENGSTNNLGALNDSTNIRIDNFIIKDAQDTTKSNGVVAKAIYVKLTVTSTRFGKEKTEKFYTASTLRGNYGD